MEACNGCGLRTDGNIEVVLGLELGENFAKEF